MEWNGRSLSICRVVVDSEKTIDWIVDCPPTPDPIAFYSSLLNFPIDKLHFAVRLHVAKGCQDQFNGQRKRRSTRTQCGKEQQQDMWGKIDLLIPQDMAKRLSLKWNVYRELLSCCCKATPQNTPSDTPFVSTSIPLPLHATSQPNTLLAPWTGGRTQDQRNRNSVLLKLHLIKRKLWAIKEWPLSTQESKIVSQFNTHTEGVLLGSRRRRRRLVIISRQLVRTKDNWDVCFVQLQRNTICTQNAVPGGDGERKRGVRQENGKEKIFWRRWHETENSLELLCLLNGPSSSRLLNNFDG